MPIYHPQERIQVKFELKYENVPQFDGLMQEKHISIANALELRFSCTNPLNCCLQNVAFLVQISMCYHQNDACHFAIWRPKKTNMDDLIWANKNWYNDFFFTAGN